MKSIHSRHTLHLMPYSLSLFATPSAEHNMSEAWTSHPSSNRNHNENEIILHYEKRVQRKRVKLEKQMIAYNWRAQKKAQIKQSKWRKAKETEQEEKKTPQDVSYLTVRLQFSKFPQNG